MNENIIYFRLTNFVVKIIYIYIYLIWVKMSETDACTNSVIYQSALVENI